MFLLSDGERLQRGKRVGQTWASKIPDFHAIDDLSLPLHPTPAVTNYEPGAIERLERGAPSHQILVPEPLAERLPPSLHCTSDGLSQSVLVPKTLIDHEENGSGAELHAQKSFKDLLPDAEVSSPVLLGSPGQLKALIQDVKMSSQASLEVPVGTGTSDTLATDTGTSDTRLRDYFQPTTNRTDFTDAHCKDITRLLRESGKVSWSVAPRLYIVLRKIDQLQVLDKFLDQGINDLWLPLNAAHLPQELSVSYHQEFLATQLLVLTKALCLENNTQGHAHLTRDDTFPFEIKASLGSGGFGSVDKILSLTSGREYARKRFRRKKREHKAERESFMNELRILKRLDHIHCVKFVSTVSIHA